MRWVVSLVGLAVAAAPAAADLVDVRLTEVATASAVGDPAARYVELEATAAACVFPSTRVVSYDAAGAVLGDVAPFASATCVAAGTFLLLATPAARAAFGIAEVDGGLVPPIDLDAGQLCLVSSATRYDCVRWGAIATPVRDLFGPDDATAAIPPPAGLALARIANTDVVAVDWRVETPSPRRPNDGTPWDPADAGTDAPRPDAGTDAAPPIDAARPDAAADAAVADASQAFLDLDPGGGAACGCASGPTPGGAAALLAVVALLARRRRATAGRRP